jgi:UPF0755 protein
MLTYALWWPNARPPQQPYYLFIRTGASYADVRAKLVADHVLLDTATFDRVSAQLRYPASVRSGRYAIKRNESNWSLIRRLRAGEQSAIRVSFPAVRTRADWARQVGRQLECGADSLLRAMTEPKLLEAIGATRETIMARFLPNTYEIYWNAKPEAVIRKMHEAYEAFWNAERLAQAKALPLTPLQVSILASIVEAESYRADERPRIAGLYLNRLRQGMMLQADPTVIFATQDFTIRRVMERHLRTDSPYNTYKYSGLPPGPINCPTIPAIEAVLAPEKHDFIFFSAKSDFSGYHNFSRTYGQHLRVANEYRNELSRQERIRDADGRKSQPK